MALAVNNVQAGNTLAKQLPGTKARADMTDVEKLVSDTKAEKAKNVNFFKSEAYFRSKANQLKWMMAFYQNIGFTEGYQAAEAEATKIVKEYAKIYGKPKTGTTTSTTA